MNRLLILLVGLLVQSSQVSAQNGLIAYYPFNGNANDESVNGNHLVVNGPVLSPDRFAKPDSAYLFDGIDDYMVIPYNPSLRPASFAATTWIRMDRAPTAGKYILTTSADLRTPPYDPFRLRLKISREIEARYEGNSDTVHIILDSNTRLQPGKWYFIATYYDQHSGDAALYIDGKLETAINAKMILDINDDVALVGAGLVAAGIVDTTTFFPGSIDDIRIFNRGLTESEIRRFFVEGTGSRKKIEVLEQNYPNPFNTNTVINYILAVPAHVVIRVYNVSGQEIRKLRDENQTQGPQVVQWDGRDEDKIEVSSGLYIYQVIAGDQKESRKMLLIK